VVDARRLAMLTWTRELNRPAIEMARVLGIASSSAAELIASASGGALARAVDLARRLRGEQPMRVVDVSEFPRTVP
jgi:hypothetical protein